MTKADPTLVHLRDRSALHWMGPAPSLPAPRRRSAGLLLRVSDMGEIVLLLPGFDPLRVLAADYVQWADIDEDPQGWLGEDELRIAAAVACGSPLSVNLGS